MNYKFGKNKKAEVVEAPKDDGAYTKRMDSLKMELDASQAKLKELSDKVDQLSKQGSVPPSENKNSQVKDSSAIKRVEDGVLIITNQKSEFKDEDGYLPPKGYYVVIGTYFYRDLAEAETKRFREKGYQTSDWVYSGPKNFNYIFMFKCVTKEEALEKLKIANQAGVKDAWLQELID